MKTKGTNKFKYRKAKRAQKEQQRRKKNLLRQTKCSNCKAIFKLKPKHITYSKNKISKQKRITILLGAGAVADWDGPISDISSRIIADDSFMTRTGDKTIGLYIFDKIREYYKEREESDHYKVNFETFIAFLENIHQYIFALSDENGNPMTSPFHPLIYKLNDVVDEIKNYRIEEIPGNLELIKLYVPPSNPKYKEIEIKSVDRYYFSELLKHYLKIIIRSIKPYSENILAERYNELNGLHRQFFKHIKHPETIVRCYSTNYDDFLIKIFGEDYVFDGFDKNTSIEGYKRYNNNKIITDRNCLNYYNLHGSIYWKFEYLNEYLDYVFIKNKDKVNDENNYYSPVYVNPGNYIFNTNIITGYNKLQRTSTEPYSAFMQSFQYDCQNSEIIITIGYSYNDFHINKHLKENTNSKERKYWHITKASNIENFKKSREYYELSSIYNQTLQNIKPNWLESNNIKIYLNGFKDFLKNGEWKRIK